MNIEFVVCQAFHGNNILSNYIFFFTYNNNIWLSICVNNIDSNMNKKKLSEYSSRKDFQRNTHFENKMFLWKVQLKTYNSTKKRFKKKYNDIINKIYYWSYHPYCASTCHRTHLCRVSFEPRTLLFRFVCLYILS